LPFACLLASGIWCTLSQYTRPLFVKKSI
jgi:hypothetical protein